MVPRVYDTDTANMANQNSALSAYEDSAGLVGGVEQRPWWFDRLDQNGIEKGLKGFESLSLPSTTGPDSEKLKCWTKLAK